ncbi:MAG TPA: N-acetyltransferase [Rhizomicrobium sp.]|nr:N-acetyltransferase [Rhizomicrobium sp.]
MGTSWQIRPERPEDAETIAVLNDDGFGPGRFAKSAYRLREGVAAERRLGFVATGDGGALLGSVGFWPILVGGELSLLLGPLAVKSELRGRGIGVALMKTGIDAARAAGFKTILLVGDESYYARAGFARLPACRVRFPGPVDKTRVLGLALQPGALDALSGSIARARIDDPVCACGAPLG